jgi:hypothetical protein
MITSRIGWLLVGALMVMAVGCGDDDAPATKDMMTSPDLGADMAPDQADEPDAEPDLALDMEPTMLTLGISAECNPLASTDECLFPYPSRFMERADATSATGRRLSIPQKVFEKAGNKPPRAELFNTADGAPTSAPILLHFGVDVDPALLNGEDQLARSLDPANPIALIDLEAKRRVMFLAEMDQNRREERYKGRHALIIRPQEPMRMGKRHVVVITGPVLDADGAPIPISPGFRALRDKIPTDHAALEAERPAYEALFTELEKVGYIRSELFMAYDLQVASRDYILGPVLSMRAKAFEMAEAGQLSYTIDEVREPAADDPNVARIILGSFEVPTYLRDDNTFLYDDKHLPVIQTPNKSFPFTMLIPKKALDGEPLPLTVLGHGIFGEGRDYLIGGNGRVTQPLAQQAGSIIIATDWIGLSGGDIDIIVNDVVSDLNRLTLVTDRLQQSLINNLAMIELARRVIQDDPKVKVGANKLLNDDVFYYGISLGGIQGSSLVSLSRHITRAILAVPGSSWANMLARSIVYQPIKAFIDRRYPDPLLQQSFITMLQLHFDHSDPVNIGLLMAREPLPDAPAGRTVVLQEAIADCQVPNQVTRILARTLGARQLEPIIEPVTGLDKVTGPINSGVVMAQFELPAVAMYRPSKENVIPVMDNNVHSDLAYEQSTQLQIVALVLDGIVRMFCDGPCDPD